MPLALSSGDQIQLVIAGITAIAALATVASVWLMVRNEQRRTQPIVIAHEEGPRRFAPQGSEGFWVVDAYLTSDGDGAAYNVRFGVEFNGVRYPYRLSLEDPEDGNVQRVLTSGERRPADGSWPILIDSLAIWGRAAESEEPGDLDAKRLYWARYENARGQTWETCNRGDCSTRLDIHRVRVRRVAAWRDSRQRQNARERGEAWERQALAELRAVMKDDPHRGGASSRIDPPETG